MRTSSILPLKGELEYLPKYKLYTLLSIEPTVLMSVPELTPTPFTYEYSF